jgi:UDP-glucose 4-epimerase
MNIVVTGANGFIGKNLVKVLSRHKEHVVHAIVREFPIEKIDSVGYHKIDLAYFETSQLNIESPDVVIHLAQSNRYREFPDGAIDIYNVNIDATFKLLEWCRQKKVRKFIFASSGSVYQKKEDVLTELDAVSTAQFYPATKVIAEQLVGNYHAYFDTVVLRIFTAYGPGQSGMLVSNIIDKIKNGQEITLAQNKGITLSPIYVDDVTTILINLLSSQIKNEIFNCGGNEIVTLKTIIQLIEEHLGKRANVLTEDGSPAFAAANSAKLFNALNLLPAITLRNGIKNMIEYLVTHK